MLHLLGLTDIAPRQKWMKNDPFLFGAWEVDDVSLTNGRGIIAWRLLKKQTMVSLKNCGVFGIQELPLFLQRFLVSKLLFFFPGEPCRTSN